MELNTQAGESKDEKVEVGKKLRAFRLTYYAMIVRERTVLLLSARLNYKLPPPRLIADGSRRRWNQSNE